MSELQLSTDTLCFHASVPEEVSAKSALIDTLPCGVQKSAILLASNQKYGLPDSGRH